jgi:hypothetical protein
MNRRTVAIVSVLVILGSLALVVRRCHAPRRRDPQAWAPLGRLAAREVAALLPAGGKVAAALFDTRRLGMQGEVSAFESFRAALKSAPGVALAGDTVLQPKKLDDGRMGFTAQQVQELLRRHAGADLLVLFGGASFVDLEGIAWDAEGTPRLVSVMSFTPEQLRPLFACRALVLSLAPPMPTPTGTAPVLRQEEGLVLQVITPATAAQAFGAPGR